MTRRAMRVLDTGLRAARWNVAASAVLAERHAAGETGDLIRFHRYFPCVLIGRHQDARTSVGKGDWQIARRVTGGGAVYMDPGVLAWELVSRGRNLAETSRAIGSCVADALRNFGVTAIFVPPGDVCIDGGKVSGSSGLAVGGTLLVQGTLVMDIDRAALGSSLAEPGPLRVTALREHLPALPTVEAMAASVVAGIEPVLGVEACPDTLSREETAEIDAAYEREYGQDAFVFGLGGPSERRAS